MFRENNIDFERVNYFIEPLTAEKLRELLKKADLKPFDVLRRNEPIFMELNLSKESADEEIIRAIVENPTLLQRPIVEVGNRAVLARPVEKAKKLIFDFC
ncbi:MAG TPA: ArsC/Spx/MgsR family protein [Pyrinomonadaceae bacterium]|nr:ArsC/Spx/MgsR family protein [Pyrinomonadaceae bacterium]